jgi:hypothetical protein
MSAPIQWSTVLRKSQRLNIAASAFEFAKISPAIEIDLACLKSELQSTESS